MDKEELINGYFENSLTSEQTQELERLYRTDLDFAQQLDYEKELSKALKSNERNEIRNMFNELKPSKEANGKKKSLVVQLRPWMMAASIALLVGVSSWLLFFNTPNQSPEELYKIHFAPYENVVHPIERGVEIEDLKTRAFSAYENEEFEKALALFKELNTKSTDSYLQFYEAIVLMQLEKHDEAIPLLENYIAADGELKERAQWYLSLSYLKTKQFEKSKSLFGEIADQNGFKSKEASNLLKELN
ncbi:tetratricopeptide repeat protein [Euzebyella saccharophila]|uniref:Tol-pal system YbgF family protein n=1 Tax=Euzebyella saccharophila TaxID=679664 RepID=A0ABV8JNN3_9FLAO|nr:hypothetical protein [Euzebyella saccharophila]